MNRQMHWATRRSAKAQARPQRQAADPEQASLNKEAHAIAMQAYAAQRKATKEGYRKAAKLYGKAAELIARGNARAEIEYLSRRAEMLCTLGHRYIDEGGVWREIVDIYRKILPGVSCASDPYLWARSWNNLGNSLWMLYRGEDPPTWLEEAVAAYQEALKAPSLDERTVNQHRLTRGNLGNAMRELGVLKKNKDLIIESIDIFCELMNAYPRDSALRDRVMSEGCVGHGYYALSMLEETDEERFSLLDDASNLYRAAEEKFHIDYIQHQLGNTLLEMGELLIRMEDWKSSMSCFEEAAEVWRAAQKAFSRKRDPHNWGACQNGIGNALKRLGELKSSVPLLEEAAAVYREALAAVKEGGAADSVKTIEENLACADAAVSRLAAHSGTR
ncbi:MAG: tetratricopeptide repeat protein [Azoarcus sp.]|nr:tetratricopeptide repeat protein [Azoarcus sp.]